MNLAETTASWKYEHGRYIRTGQPLSNIQATLEAAQNEGVLNRASRQIMEEVSVSIFYQERNWEKIINRCGKALSPKIIKDFSNWLGKGYVDQQALDAMELLKCMRDPAPSIEIPSNADWKDCVMTKSIQERFIPQERNGTRVSPTEIVGYAALHHPEFSEINFNALNRKLAMLLAHELGVESDPELEKIEEERFRRRRKLNDANDFSNWLKENDLNTADFKEMMAERAVCHRLHRWLMQVKQPYNKNTKAVLEELKMRGEFPELADKVAARSILLKEIPEKVEQDETVETRKLFRKHLKQTAIPWEYDYRVQIQEYGLTQQSFFMELYKSHKVREYVRTLVIDDVEDSPKES